MDDRSMDRTQTTIVGKKNDDEREYFTASIYIYRVITMTVLLKNEYISLFIV